MFARSSILVAALWFCSPALLAQVPGPVQQLPLDLKTPKLGKHYGPFCSGDRAYSMVPLDMNGTGRSDVGIIHYMDGSRPARVTPLKIPFMKLHDTFNAVFVHQGQPCIVYDSWDVGTGLVKFYLQRYSADTFEEEGTPLPIGEAQFNERYVQPDLRLTVRSSPDGEKLLLFYDHAGNKGFKVALCWVLDAEFESVWFNAYKLPVFAYGSRSEVKLTDDGEVLLSVVGVPVTDELIKLEEDGSEKVRSLSASLSNTSYSAYRMRGDVFETWSGQLSGGQQFLAGSVCKTREGLFFTGILPVQQGEKPLKWVMLRLEEQLLPSEMLAEGPAAGVEVGDFLPTQLCATPDGNMLFLKPERQMIITAFAPDGSMQWSTTTPWGVRTELATRGNTFFAGADLSPGDLANIKEGKQLKETFDTRPAMLTWDDTGKTIITPLIPFSYPIKKGAYYNTMQPSFQSIATCGDYVDWDNERRPSLYRVTLE
jgi:hypothetical protein